MESLNLSSNLEELVESKRSKKASTKRKANPVVIEYESKKENTEPTKFQPDSVEIENSSNWETFYGAIKEMRKERNAPVDSMGASSQFDPKAHSDTQNFQILIATVLSVQTKDQTVDKAMKRLKEYGLTVDSMHAIDPAKLKELIFECNFNATKVKNIKEIARMLKEDMNGKLPTDLNGCLKFPGVGKKVALIYLNYALKKLDGIAVDTHLHRISNRLGVIKTNTPEETRVALQNIVKKEDWGEVTEIFVGFGQQVCLPIGPRCGECTLKDSCPEGKKNVLISAEKFKKKAKSAEDAAKNEQKVQQES